MKNHCGTCQFMRTDEDAKAVLSRQPDMLGLDKADGGLCDQRRDVIVFLKSPSCEFYKAK